MNLKSEYTILIVENSLSVRALYRNYLLADNYYHYRILETETLEAGLNCWRSQNSLETIDLVLIALVLPDGSGLKFVESIKAEYSYPELPIIVIAEQDDRNLIVQSVKLGIRDYLNKAEITKNILLRSVASALKELELAQQCQINQQIAQREVWLKKIIDTVPGMLYTLVRRTNGSYYFDYISPLVEDILEVTAQEGCYNPQCIFQQIHPDDIEDYLIKVEESFTNMTLFNCEWRVITPSGKEKWLKAASLPEKQPDGQVIWFGFCFEITDLKNTQQQLHQLNQTLEVRIAERTRKLWEINHLQTAILNSSDLGIITTDFEGIIQSFNRGAEKMLGYRAEAVIGQYTPDHFFDSVTMKRLAKKLSLEFGKTIGSNLRDLNLQTQYFSQEKEQICIRQDGSCFPVMLSVRLLENEQRQIIGFLHICRDITERKQSEIELQNAYSELEKLLKLREETLTLREDMSNMIIHDLRNPLTAMMLSAEIILKYGDRADARSIVTKQANQMLQAGKHITNMIDSLLLMAKLESDKIILNPTLTDLHGLGLSIIADFQLMANLQNSQLTSQLPPPGTHLLIDSIILRRIIENLLSNAFKFSPPQSQIHLVMEVLPQDHLRITVADNGPGIDLDSYEKIFGKFEIGQIKEDVPQIGLGLAFCKMAIEAQGGTLAIAPNQPQGSIFIVEI